MPARELYNTGSALCYPRRQFITWWTSNTASLVQRSMMQQGAVCIQEAMAGAATCFTLTLVILTTASAVSYQFSCSLCICRCHKGQGIHQHALATRKPLGRCCVCVLGLPIAPPVARECGPWPRRQIERHLRCWWMAVVHVSGYIAADWQQTTTATTDAVLDKQLWLFLAGGSDHSSV